MMKKGFLHLEALSIYMLYFRNWYQQNQK